MHKITSGLMTAVWLVSCSPVSQMSSVVCSDLAPSGTLRAAINYANPVLAQGSPATGDLREPKSEACANRTRIDDPRID